VRFAQSGTVFEVELAREGCDVVERRHGPTPSEERRPFPTEREANTAYYQRIAELVEIGWDRRSGCETVDEPGDADLLAGVSAFDPDALAVYTDLLLERGDPRGELATLRATARDTAVTTRLAQLEHEHRGELFGALAMLPDGYREQFELVYRRGWIAEIHARYRWTVPKVDERAALYFVLHAPMTRFAHTLELDGSYATACLQLRCEHLGRFRTLRLTAGGSMHVLDVLPGLEELVVGYNAHRGHPGIRRLTITASPDGTVAFGGDWPALEHVTIEHAKPLDQRSLRPLEAELARRGVTLEISG
jgi:hypothetical protein